MSISVANATEQTLPIARAVPPQAPPLRWRLLAIAAIVVAAFNARTAVTAVGAALPELRAALGLGTMAVAVLTALPCLCIAATTLLVPFLRRRMGTLTSVVAFLVVLMAGQAVRIAHGQWLLLAGTVLACCAIGGLQVLLPAVCQWFGGRHAAALATLSASMIGVGAATATATTPWLIELGGWRTALGAWILPVVAALVLWTPLSHSAEARSPAPRFTRGRSLLRSPRAWYLTMFMGLQSLQALSLMSWQPVLLRTTGSGPGHAAALSAGTLVASIVSSAVITASCYRNARYIGTWMVLTTASGGIGLLGLLIAPGTGPVLWAGLLGVGMSALAPAMAAIPAHTTGSGETTRLSAMTQGYGYLLAAIGPALIGALTDVSTTADWALTALLFFSLLQFLFAALTARPATSAPLTSSGRRPLRRSSCRPAGRRARK